VRRPANCRSLLFCFGLVLRPIVGIFYSFIRAARIDPLNDLNSPAKKYGETAPQLLTTSGEIDLGGIAVTSIEFVDWLAAIGIDNLTLTEAPPTQHGTPPVPAPPALSLFVLGLGGLGDMRRRRAA
jgi:hypothetical protein